MASQTKPNPPAEECEVFALVIQGLREMAAGDFFEDARPGAGSTRSWVEAN
ncbi:MAG: hypothetical protein HC897_10390 [Thermoanaerobaculia bacterium]|nr:hypothetical protein [Thermoanaerobaculia bacterium]